MASKNEVEKFLDEFKYKMKYHKGVYFRDDRPKNLELLSALEFTASKKISILNSLKVENYSEGPLPDSLNKGADMWVFGAVVKKREVYIKITLGLPNKQPTCISFHFSEHPIKYKFK